MNIEVVRGDINQQSVGAIIISLFEGDASLHGAIADADRRLGGAISSLIEEGEIKGKFGQITVIHTLGKMTPTRVVVAGMGKLNDFTQDRARFHIAESLRSLRGISVSSVATVAHGAGTGGLDTRSLGQAIAEGAVLGLYRLDKYKSSPEECNKIDKLIVVEQDNDKIIPLRDGINDGLIVSDAVNFSRDMVNEPANIMTPTRMAELALEVSQENDLEIEVLDRQQMKAMGMGALLGVAQGSEEPPKFIILRYRGDPERESNNLGLLGKGVTFDSGGLDIKTASGMATMKVDMAGGASVISAMKAIGQLRPKLNVTCLVAATENMPSGSAQRPGDIVRTMSGKTIEIDNTDAEGRLVLADAMSYARSIGLNKLVDVATLTGAVVIALGNHCTGAFGNDQEFIDQVISAGERVGERIWPFPMYEEYRTQYKSDFADIKNTGGRGGGSITGAQIIGEFADGASWVHLDIAGTALSDNTKGYNTKGATGIPVRTLINLAQSLGAT